MVLCNGQFTFTILKEGQGRMAHSSKSRVSRKLYCASQMYQYHDPCSQQLSALCEIVRNLLYSELRYSVNRLNRTTSWYLRFKSCSEPSALSKAAVYNIKCIDY